MVKQTPVPLGSVRTRTSINGRSSKGKSRSVPLQGKKPLSSNARKFYEATKKKRYRGVNWQPEISDSMSDWDKRQAKLKRKKQVTLAMILKKLRKNIKHYRVYTKDQIRSFIRSTKSFLLDASPERDVLVISLMFVTIAVSLAIAANLTKNFDFAVLQYYVGVPLAGFLGILFGVRFEKTYEKYEYIGSKLVIAGGGIPATLFAIPEGFPKSVKQEGGRNVDDT